MDWTAALTLAFAGIGAATGLLTFGNEVSKRRAERQSRNEEAARDWSLTAKTNADIAGWTLQLRYDAPQQAPMTLVSIRLIAPKGATLSRAKHVRTQGDRDVTVSADDVWSDAIDLNLEMTPGILMGRGVGLQQTDYATRSVVCRLSDSAEAARIRFRASLTIEDNSAARRRISFIVASQEIAWTASSAVKAT